MIKDKLRRKRMEYAGPIALPYHFTANLECKWVEGIDKGSGRSSDTDNSGKPTHDARVDEANIITSQHKGGGMHMPVLDLDMPCELVPSSQEEHYHLYIGKRLTWQNYQLLMWVLSHVGIIEHGYYETSRKRGFSAVRLPWVAKGDCAE